MGVQHRDRAGRTPNVQKSHRPASQGIRRQKWRQSARLLLQSSCKKPVFYSSQSSSFAKTQVAAVCFTHSLIPVFPLFGESYPLHRVGQLIIGLALCLIIRLQQQFKIDLQSSCRMRRRTVSPFTFLVPCRLGPDWFEHYLHFKFAAGRSPLLRLNIYLHGGYSKWSLASHTERTG